MQLQRYFRINRAQGEFFGDHTKSNTWDFTWYLGHDRIGIENEPSTEAESFIGGLLAQDDRLIITPSAERPRIQREKVVYGTMRGPEGGIEEISALIKLLQEHETIHAFTTSKRHDGRWPSILTFSVKEPATGLYTLGKIMPVVLEARL